MFKRSLFRMHRLPHLLATIGFLFGVAISTTARAQYPTPVASRQGGMNSVIEHPGFDLGVRLGYAIPFGDVFQNAGLADGLSGAIPFVLEAGYRFNPNVTAGLLFQYAFGQPKNCPDSCSASIVRFGAEAIYSFRTGNMLDPWLGAAIGYEWLNTSETGTPDAQFSGVEFLTLQGGADYRMGPQFALGPFLSFSIARYGSASSGGTSVDIPQTAMHEWLQLGVRGTFNL